MQVRFRTNLGTTDAALIKEETGVELECDKCVYEAMLDIPDKAAELVVKYGIGEVRMTGQAKKPEITAPAENSVRKLTDKFTEKIDKTADT